MPLGLGIWEIVILLVVVALVVGPKSVPRVARTFGLGFREFTDTIEGPQRELKEALDPKRMLESPPPPEPKRPSSD